MVEGINNKRGKKVKKEEKGGGMRFTGQWRGMPVIKGQMVGARMGNMKNNKKKQ